MRPEIFRSFSLVLLLEKCISMKKIIFFFFILKVVCFYGQDVTANDIINSLNRTTFKLDKKTKIEGDILSSKMENKNYFFKRDVDSLYLFVLQKKDHLTIFFLMPSTLFNHLKKELNKKYEEYDLGMSGVSNELLIYNEIKQEFYFLENYEPRDVSVNRKNNFAEFFLYFDNNIPIVVLDRDLKFKYCFFSTSKDGDYNLAYYEFIYKPNYFQANSYAQKEMKNLNIMDMKFDDLEKVCQEETVLIKKEYYKNFETRSFMIYHLILMNYLDPHFLRRDE